MITTFVFDIGGVLFNQSDAFRREWMLQGLPDAAFADDIMFGGDLWELYKRGALTEEDYWDRVLSHFPPHFREAWPRLYSAWERSIIVNEDVAALVRELKIRHRVHALSNAGAELERRLAWFGLQDLFEHVINSHRVRMAKPDVAIYRYTCDLVEARPEETLFVDDKVRNTSVAEALGFRTHVFTDVDALREDLHMSGIEVSF